MIANLTNWLASRPRRTPATTVVLHATDGASGASSINWLRRIGLSYHYVIERDGQVTKCVPVGRVAFHAGVSEGPDGADVNRYSVGIAFANWESQGELITQAQVDACKNLVQVLARNIPTLQYLTTHRAISPGRKNDPSRLSLQDRQDIARAGNLQGWRLKR